MQRSSIFVTVYSYYSVSMSARRSDVTKRRVLEALQLYSEKFGPYRHKTLAAVQGVFNRWHGIFGFVFISATISISIGMIILSIICHDRGP